MVFIWHYFLYNPNWMNYFQAFYHGIDHHWRDTTFVTCGQQVDIWDESRAEPVRTFSWGVDTIHSVKFNPVEVQCIVTCVVHS